MNSQAAYSNLF